ncbi:hypothetical protein KC19_3G214900 [Ceratodon purpureus]|uniref:Cell cycle checkpoint control protein RAD9A n=1 Tax=Ceratodon purpureus TaxID=3225 RepID=A0A8T0IPI4_CERPU|nr:hypothetical protein KC19_3G214900 [Ceratodon purpureus]
MECVLSGIQIKSLNRAVNCLYRVGSELLIEVLPDRLSLRTLNTAWSAFLSVTFKGQFFDSYRVNTQSAACSVLLKSVVTVFRTPPGSMEQLTITLPDKDANKLQWTIQCINGIRKTYWITCNNDTEMQNVMVERDSFPSHLVIKPKDLGRLLGHFQSSLQEITLIATEPVSTEMDPDSEAKAIELKSYIDPARDTTDGALHTQLWIDPSEELSAYTHKGPPVDVTFSVKELKAFMAFCEGAEADMHMFFDKAGKPVLIAPRFGLDDSAHSDFDATLVLATMMSSQLHGAEESADQAAANQNSAGPSSREGSQDRAASHDSVRRGNLTPGSAHRSDETAIWSDLSGSGGRTSVTQRRTSINQPTPVQYIPQNPRDSEDAQQNLPDSEGAHRNLQDSEDPHRNLQDSEDARRNLPDTEDASEEIPTLHRRELASARRKRLRKRSEMESSPDPSPVQMFPEAGLQPLRDPNALRRESTSTREPPRETFQRQLPGGQLEEVPQPRGTTTWEDNSSDADYDEDTGEADDEFCVPTTPPERRGPY